MIKVHDDNVDLSGENINLIRRNIEALLDTVKKEGPEVNAEKTNSKYMFISHLYTTG
jgi:hypothetical protein